ncbi:hypothetical protein M8C21_030914 [Ambrosia artemisiifolia]|uniref:Uncharacterized protein n=1 Tax=Ambrosia artemisiifolia TaxID=4212 RepID=A0AAD5CZG5_AMBAR|nr:hypothetical protein M8C21_030914 [Ambrosia artemisiifolia]
MGYEQRKGFIQGFILVVAMGEHIRWGEANSVFLGLLWMVLIRKPCLWMATMVAVIVVVVHSGNDHRSVYGFSYKEFHSRALRGLRNGDIFHSADIISKYVLIKPIDDNTMGLGRCLHHCEMNKNGKLVLRDQMKGAIQIAQMQHDICNMLFECT